MKSSRLTRNEKPYHHGNLREALLEAALNILEKDSEALTIRAAATAIGVSHTAPYNHFADKDALLAAIAIRGFERLKTKVETARERAGVDAGEQLAATGRAYVLFAAERPALFRLMFGPRKAEAHAEEIRAAGHAAFEALVEVTRYGMASDVFRKGDPQVAAFTAWSLVHGMAQLAVDRTGPLTTEDREDLMVRLLASHDIVMDGLRPR